MPFTLAHPAAVAPIARAARGRLSLRGLVLGSIVPDLDVTRHWNVSIGPLDEGDSFSHTLPGVFLFCLPAAFALGWLYDRFVREALPRALPDALVAPPREGPARPRAGAALFAASALIGIATHLGWDTLTSRSGPVAGLGPGMREPVLSWRGVDLSPHGIFSLANSAAGVVLAAALVPRPARRGPGLAAAGKARFWAKVGGAALAAGVALAAFRYTESRRYDDVARFLDGAMLGGFAALCALGRTLARAPAAVPARAAP